MPGRGSFWGVGFQQFQNLFHHLFHLGIPALNQHVGIIPHLKIRCHSLTFPKPVAVVIVESGAGDGDTAAVDQLVTGCGTYQDTQGSFANDGAGFQFLKRPWAGRLRLIRPSRLSASPSVRYWSCWVGYDLVRAASGDCRPPVA